MERGDEHRHVSTEQAIDLAVSVINEKNGLPCRARFAQILLIGMEIALAGF